MLDPFGGSGTTLAVAKKLCRRWIGFELSPEYAASIEKRLAEIKREDALNGADDPLQHAPDTVNGIRVEDRVGGRTKRRKRRRNGPQPQGF